jgi:hypothetical protein
MLRRRADHFAGHVKVQNDNLANKDFFGGNKGSGAYIG